MRPLVRKVLVAVDRTGGLCGRLVKMRLWARYRLDPVPLDRLIARRRFLWGYNPLSPGVKEVRDSPESLESADLQVLLKGAELGTWSMHPQSLNMIGRSIRERKPALVIELGSGWSTVCFAFFMQEVWGSDPHLRVLSVEQEGSFAARTRHLLASAQLDHLVEVREVPVETEQDPPGYVDAALSESVGGLQAQMFVIDGPAGAPGIRRGTLPRLVQLACHPRGAIFFLDDALRDAELAAAEEWGSAASTHIHGVVLSGTGLLIGEVHQYPLAQ